MDEALSLLAVVPDQVAKVCPDAARHRDEHVAVAQGLAARIGRHVEPGVEYRRVVVLVGDAGQRQRLAGLDDAVRRHGRVDEVRALGGRREGGMTGSGGQLQYLAAVVLVGRIDVVEGLRRPLSSTAARVQ